MQKNIKVPVSIFNKEAILYTLSIHLDEWTFSVDEVKWEYIINLDWLDDDQVSKIKKDLYFNSLRFEIAEQNKDLRKAIISKALWTVNYGE